MTDRYLLALARRAVACKRWRWMPGMRGVTASGGTDRIMDESEAAQPNSDLLPDFTDPATLGCLLHLVREAWGDPWARVQPFGRPDNFGWRVIGIEVRVRRDQPTEAAALVAALEAAPPPT